MKKIFLYIYFMLSICLFFYFGDMAAAEQNPAGRSEIASMEENIRKLQARLAEMTRQTKCPETSPLTAPADVAAGPCYEGAYHAHHDYRCYPGCGRHYSHH